MDQNTGWAPGVVPMASGIFHSGVSNGFGDVFFPLLSAPAEHRDGKEQCYATRQRLWNQDGKQAAIGKLKYIWNYFFNHQSAITNPEITL